VGEKELFCALQQYCSRVFGMFAMAFHSISVLNAV
jgi:hypothetical protein